ncbi:3-ketoacyl-CoA thiolase [Streptomyces tendae]
MSPLAPQPTRRVAVLGGARVPFARSDGPYATASNQEMLTAALNGLVERHGLQGPGAVGEFVAGAVLKHSRDFNLARETVLGSALDPRTPAYDIQQACGTGLQAVIAAANKIALGQTESAIAGGADTASDAPLGVNDRLRLRVVQAQPPRWPGRRSSRRRAAAPRPSGDGRRSCPVHAARRCPVPGAAPTSVGRCRSGSGGTAG